MADAVNTRVRDIAPGIWEDANGAAHFDIPALLEHFEIPNTPDNVEMAIQMAEAMLKAKGGKFVVRHSKQGHN